MGAPFGNTNGNKNRPATLAIMRELERESQHKGRITTRMRIMAEQLVDQACEGNLTAIDQVLNRVEGRPTQRIEAQHSTNAPQLIDKQELLRALELVMSDAKLIEGTATPVED